MSTATPIDDLLIEKLRIYLEGEGPRRIVSIAICRIRFQHTTQIGLPEHDEWSVQSRRTDSIFGAHVSLPSSLSPSAFPAARSC
jgi:hypothetical protein